MSENMYCNSQKGNSKAFRDGWDKILWKDKEDEKKAGEKTKEEEKEK